MSTMEASTSSRRNERRRPARCHLATHDTNALPVTTRRLHRDRQLVVHRPPRLLAVVIIQLWPAAIHPNVSRQARDDLVFRLSPASRTDVSAAFMPR